MAKTTVEDQIAHLKKIGILTNETLNMDDIFGDFNREELEETPFDFLIASCSSLGQCQRLRCFDMGAIEPQPGYAEVLTQLNAMVGDELDLKNIKDNFKDIFARKAEVIDDMPETFRALVSFENKGQHTEWELAYRMEYLDENLFYNFNQLLSDEGSHYQIYHIADFQYLALTLEQKSELSNLMKSKIVTIKKSIDYSQ